MTTAGSTAEAAIERIASLCRDVAAAAPPERRERLAQLGRRLAEPLQVAVAGRVKSGKSTLVNALLGQRVARTDARECTRVVTWFSYGPAQKVTVLGRDGSRHRTGLDEEGLIPEDLGMPAHKIASVEVELSLRRLRGFNLADTPGLDSPDAAVSRVTEDLLGVDADSQKAIAAAEAVLFVINQEVRQSDVEVLRAFRAVSRGSGSDAVTAFGVLNKADKLGGGDPMVTGGRKAAKAADDLRTELAAVVAYSGLYAETARCGVFTEADATALVQLAGLDPVQREGMLSEQAAGLFGRTNDGVTEAERRRLWRLLQEAGMRTALMAIDDGKTGAAALCSHLDGESGHPIVDRHISEVFEANAPALKATAALDTLEAEAWSAGGAWGADVRDRVEALRLAPDLHILAEFDALRRVRRGEVTLPDSLADELARLVATPMAARSDIATGLRRWQTYASSGVRPAEAHVARVLVRSYEIASRKGTTR